MKKKLIVFLMVLALIVSALPVLANQPTDAEIVPDVLIVRPLGLLAIATGAVIFVISLPFSIPSGSVQTVGKRLVVDPSTSPSKDPSGISTKRSGPGYRRRAWRSKASDSFSGSFRRAEKKKSIEGHHRYLSIMRHFSARIAANSNKPSSVLTGKEWFIRRLRL